jgi:hypothetical protein
MKLNPCKKCGSGELEVAHLYSSNSIVDLWYGIRCGCGNRGESFVRLKDAYAAWNAANPVEEAISES